MLSRRGRRERLGFMEIWQNFVVAPSGPPLLKVLRRRVLVDERVDASVQSIALVRVIVIYMYYSTHETNDLCGPE